MNQKQGTELKSQTLQKLVSQTVTTQYGNIYPSMINFHSSDHKQETLKQQ